MNKNIKVFIIGLVVFVIVGIVGVLALMEMFKPSDKVMSLNDYFGVSGDNETVLILQNKICEDKALYENGETYINYDIVKSELNSRFYWDKNEKKLIYTLPTQIIEVLPDQNEYTINGESNDFGKTIIHENNGTVTIALSFIQKFSNVKTESFSEPNRTVICYKWGEEQLVSTTAKDTQLRYDGSVKSDILKELSSGEKVTYITEENSKMSKGFIKVISEDGIIGYVKESELNNSEYETLESDFKEPEYTNIKKDYDINLTWNVVTNQTANDNMPNLLDKTKGVNTISPTWFSLADNTGNLNSLASESYVKEAHDRGVEVWALVDDFTTDVKVSEVLGYTTTRRNLIDNIMKQMKDYKLDGINIDFEKIKSDFAEDYVQFIRELSIECRKNDKVLSIDSYVPMSYSSFYNRAEQAAVADYVIIMAYDEHYAGSSESGSVSSISWVQTAIDNTLEQVSDSNKVIIAIPFYARLWEEEVNTDGSTSVVSSKALSMGDSQSNLMDNSALINWDDETKQNYAEYNKAGHLFRMWVEDEKSIEEKMKVISKADVGGIANWRLGFESDKVWGVIGKYINK